MSMEKMFTKWGGGEVLKKAVRGMLPKNRLRDQRLARLKGVFRTSRRRMLGNDPDVAFLGQSSRDLPTLTRRTWSKSVAGDTQLH